MDQVAPVSESAAARDRLRWRLAVGGMVLAMVIFGANFVVSRHAILNGLTPHDLLALRFGTAGLLLLPIFLARPLSSCGGVGWRRGIILALMSGAPMSYLQFTGLLYAPAAHGATIAPALVTMIGIVGGVLLFGTRLTRQLVLGICAVLAGLACLGMAGSTHTDPTILLGDLYFVSVGLIWGSYPLLIQLWKVDALKATAMVSVLSLLYLPLYALFFFRGFDVAPWWVILLHAINQGVLNLIVGLLIWSWAARVLGAAVVGRFPPLIPVAGTLLGIPVLGELPGGLQIAGIALIICGLFIASWRRSARPALQPHQGEIPDDADRQPEPQRRP